MKLIRLVVEQLSRWIDVIANAIVDFVGRFSKSRIVELREGENGAFSLRSSGKGGLSRMPLTHLQFDKQGSLQSHSADVTASLKGSRAEITLQPSRFVFRQIEFPRRASDFLDGIVRAQVDRLTPWSATEAVYGWSKPVDIANDKIAVTLAATARAIVMPYVQAVSGLGADSIAVSTVPDTREQDTAPITVLEQTERSVLEPRSVRRALVTILLVAVLAAGLSAGAVVVVADDLAARQDDLARRLAQRRAALRTSLDAEGETALARIERRKHETASSVVIIEALAHILPDHTYVTELRIEANKIQVIGVTRDAPSLIRLIEQSTHFTHATFFAPTTRSPSDPGDRFHIEARVEPTLAAPT